MGLLLSFRCFGTTDVHYTIFKDLVPLILAIPAAWLGYCFSLRLSFASQLSVIWKELNTAVQHSVYFLDGGDISTEKYHEVQIMLRIAIDEVRSVFKNTGEEKNKRGLYPFEEIKQIYAEFNQISPEDQFDKIEAKESKDAIIEHWKNVRQPFLNEFERNEPTTPSSPYLG